MDVLSKAMDEFTSEVDLTLESIYEYFCIEGVEILSGKNFYHTRIYSLVRNLEHICCSLSALDIYTALRRIYTKDINKLHFMNRAKAMLDPYIRSNHGRSGASLTEYQSSSPLTDRAPALSYPAYAAQ
jgi:hypothetical protein